MMSVLQALLGEAGRVFLNKGTVRIHTLSGSFDVTNAEADTSTNLVHCEAAKSNAEITIVGSAIVAVEELPESYP